MDLLVPVFLNKGYTPGNSENSAKIIRFFFTILEDSVKYGDRSHPSFQAKTLYLRLMEELYLRNSWHSF